ncbi:MAG: hypothetical protein U9N77_07845, partial [Thermodesulfobacteriota bacterium]|nr:hypothetical protein [Thermodesulfobacteriota bacterium]
MMSQDMFITNPYENLYIYYLKGRVSLSSVESEKNFIGNWEEDGFSFLFFSSKVDDAVEKIVF